ncbi:hypothetical protein AAVH_35063 [Aphelenchoides avenae]|nr:hypothetical protein AAVH_35063 [Aphelenchus avenae]
MKLCVLVLLAACVAYVLSSPVPAESGEGLSLQDKGNKFEGLAKIPQSAERETRDTGKENPNAPEERPQRGILKGAALGAIAGGTMGAIGK